MKDFIVANRNYLILLMGGAIALSATIFYYHSNLNERIYRQFRGAVETDLPSFRSRAMAENSLALVDLDIALSKKEYPQAVSYLEDMILADPHNISLKYYTAILHEQQKNYQKAIDHYQTVRFNSEIFHLEALKRLSLLYVKLYKNDRANEMLTELSNMGTSKDRKWARDVATSLTSK